MFNLFNHEERISKLEDKVDTLEKLSIEINLKLGNIEKTLKDLKEEKKEESKNRRELWIRIGLTLLAGTIGITGTLIGVYLRSK